MRRVTSKEDYWDNWTELRDAVVFIVLDAAIAIGLLALMVVVIIPAVVCVTIGLAPNVEGE